jgi:hypothetical protein
VYVTVPLVCVAARASSRMRASHAAQASTDVARVIVSMPVEDRSKLSVVRSVSVALFCAKAVNGRKTIKCRKVLRLSTNKIL